jgi:hypothetical protein
VKQWSGPCAGKVQPIRTVRDALWLRRCLGGTLTLGIGHSILEKARCFQQTAHQRMLDTPFRISSFRTMSLHARWLSRASCEQCLRRPKRATSHFPQLISLSAICPINTPAAISHPHAIPIPAFAIAYLQLSLIPLACPPACFFANCSQQ